MTKSYLVNKSRLLSLFFAMLAVACISPLLSLSLASCGIAFGSESQATKNRGRPSAAVSWDAAHESRAPGLKVELTIKSLAAQLPAFTLAFSETTLSKFFNGERIVVAALCLFEALCIVVLLRGRMKLPRANELLAAKYKPPIDRTKVLSSLMESAMDAIIVVDRDDRIVLFNAVAERSFGCTASEAVGSSIERFIPRRFRVAYRTRITNLTERAVTNATTRPIGALWGLRANGEEFPIETSIVEFQSQGEILATLTIRDITERLQVEQAVRDSEERFRLVTNAAPVLVWTAGTDGLCTYFNKAWLAFTGRSMTFEIGGGWWSGVHGDDRQKCIDIYKDVFGQGEEFRMEFRLRRYDGEFRWIYNIGLPKFNVDGSFAGYVGSCIDVTDRKRAEGDRIKMLEEIAHLNRVASMGQMAASLAHELAQPLAAILSNAQAAARFASRAEPDMGEIRGALADIAEDDERARFFVQSMRSMFQKQPITRTQFDLNKITCNVSRLVKNDAMRRGVQLRVVSGPDPIFVNGDTIILQQILLNLVSNGIDALQQVSSSHKLLTLTATVRPNTNSGTILVEDNGCGIPETLKPKLFTPFFTTKTDGLGMGLSICRSLIESLDGHITLLDRAESGAAFLVELPLAAHCGPELDSQLDQSQSSSCLALGQGGVLRRRALLQ